MKKARGAILLLLGFFVIVSIYSALGRRDGDGEFQGASQGLVDHVGEIKSAHSATSRPSGGHIGARKAGAASQLVLLAPESRFSEEDFAREPTTDVVGLLAEDKREWMETALAVSAADESLVDKYRECHALIESEEACNLDLYVGYEKNEAQQTATAKYVEARGYERSECSSYARCVANTFFGREIPYPENGPEILVNRVDGVFAINAEEFVRSNPKRFVRGFEGMLAELESLQEREPSPSMSQSMIDFNIERIRRDIRILRSLFGDILGDAGQQ